MLRPLRAITWGSIGLLLGAGCEAPPEAGLAGAPDDPPVLIAEPVHPPTPVPPYALAPLPRGAPDLEPPALLELAAVPSLAGPGTLVELTFRSSEPLPEWPLATRNPAVSFADGHMACSSRGLSHRCTITTSLAMGDGPRGFVLEAWDEAGNGTGPITPALTVLLDATPPVLSVVAQSAVALRGDPLVFLVTASEALGAVPEISAGFADRAPVCTGAVPGDEFTCEGASVSAGAGRGPASFTATGSDLAGNVGTSEAAELLIRVPPAVVVDGIEPGIARTGDVLAISFSGDQPLTACGATVAGAAAVCAFPSGAACSCSFQVDVTTPDGPAEVVVLGTSADGTSTAIGTVSVDQVPPVVDGSLVSLERNPVGVNEGVSSAPGGVVDPGVDYPGRAVRTVRIWDAPSGGAEVLAVAAAADGSFAEAALPGTSELGPTRLWASAADSAGNEGTRVELAGAALSGPTGDGERLVLVRRPIGQVDSARGDPALFAGTCAAASIELFDSGSGGASIGVATLRADRSFAEVPIGTADSSPGRIWAIGRDKCGLAGPSFEGLTGRDLEPPSLDRSLITFHRRATGTEDGVSAAAGAITDAPDGFVPQVRLFDAAVGGAQVGVPPIPDGSGGFVELAVGDTEYSGLWIEATDKVGNTTRVSTGALTAVLTLAGRVPYDATGPGIALVPFVSDLDPRTAAPGYGAMLAGEASSAEAELVTAVDDRRLVLEASPAPRDEPAAWKAPGPDPPPRSGASMVFDAARGVTVLFGGQLGGTDCLADTWEYDGVAWVQRAPVISPPPRMDAAIAYDSARGRVILFGGGRGTTQLADTWEWDGLSWMEVVTLQSPPARWGGSMAYDAGRGVTVLFGGQHYGTDTWEYDGSSWTQAAPASSPTTGRAWAGMEYDVGRGKTVLFDGYRFSGRTWETWEYDGLTWTQVPLTPGVAWQSGRAALAYDPGAGKIALFHTGPTRAETWHYDGTRWTQLSTQRPLPARTSPSMVHDGVRSRLVLFAGHGQWGPNPGDTWEWDGNSWSQVRPNPPCPDMIYSRPFAYDVRRERLVLVDCSPRVVWEHDGASWATATATLPPGQFCPDVLVYDAARGRMMAVEYSSVDSPFLETWAYDGASWTLLPDLTPLQGRYRPFAAYDALRERVVMFGGGVDAWQSTETWEHDGTSWALLSPATTPTRRTGASMVYDAVRAKTILFGGNDPQPGVLCRDTWEYDGTDWMLTAQPTSPSGRERAAMVFDARRGKTLLHGGATNGGSLRSDTWEYDGAGWSEVLPQSALHRSSHPLGHHAASGRSILHGGNNGGDDTWIYEPAIPHARTPAHAMTVRFEPGLVPTEVSITYVGAATGDSGGASTAGVELLIWNRTTSSWTSLGSHSALDSDPALARTLTTGLGPGATPAHVVTGRAFLLAVPAHASSVPPGTATSSLWTDFVELQVTYSVP